MRTVSLIFVFLTISTVYAQSWQYPLIEPVERSPVSMIEPRAEYSESKSSIQWFETEYECGKIRMNQQVEATFSFINQSDRAIVIEWVKGSCSCLKTVFSPSAIEPGEERKISAVFTIQTLGKFSEPLKMKFVHSSEVFLLKIQGEVDW